MSDILGDNQTFIYLPLAAGLISLSIKSLSGGLSYLAHFRRSLSGGNSPKGNPRVSVLIPVRGVDDGLRENMAAVLDQEYPSFDVTIIADDFSDPALAELSSEIESGRLRVHISEKAEGQSGKISKLMSAVASLPEATEVILFADSDARPSSHWMSALVRELDREGIGASTGYRWFLPTGPSLATEIRSSWNASVASVLGADPSGNFCWGGSTAIKRSLFESLGIAERWRGALSDDYVIMRTMRDAGLGIAFVPAAMTASIENCGLRGLLEFTTRQMKITRVYAPKFWILSLISSLIHCLVVSWSIALIALSSDEFLRTSAVLTLALVWGLGVAKARLRMMAMGLAMPQHRDRLKRQMKWQLILWTVTPFVFLYNCLAALVSREVTWRGIRYRMVSPSETEII